MRAIIAGLGLAAFLLVGLFQSQTAWAWGKAKKTDASATGTAAPAAKEPRKKTDKAKEAAAQAQKILVDKKRQELNNTEWSVELSLLSAKGKKEPDAIVFKENQVSVASFSKKGFPVTNYTVTVQDDGTTIWETMQSSEKFGVAFWRGEIDPEMQKMHGILSYHIDDKTARDYSFVSVSKKDISPVPAK